MVGNPVGNCTLFFLLPEDGQHVCHTVSVCVCVCVCVCVRVRVRVRVRYSCALVRLQGLQVWLTFRGIGESPDPQTPSKQARESHQQ